MRGRADAIGPWARAWQMPGLALPAVLCASAALAAPVESLSLEQLEAQRRAETAQQRGYQDRFMKESDASGTGDQAQKAASPEPMGLRSWLLETRLGGTTASATGADGYRQGEWGVRAEYRLETLNHGDWLFQADGRLSSGDTGLGLGGGWWGSTTRRSGLRATVTNLGLPVTSHWLADTRVGDIYSELTTGLARAQRLSLGTTTLRGFSTRLYSGGTELRAGWGERGDLAGGPYPGFETSQGRLGWFGGTRPWGERGYVAAQLGVAQGIPQFYTGWLPDSGQGRQDVTSWALAVGQGRSSVLESERWRWRASLLGSHRSADGTLAGASDAQGLYVEAGRRFGRFSHEFGFHVGRPDLYFGDQRLYGGTRGLYWRMDYSALRLNWGLGLDHESAGTSGGGLYPGYRRTALSANVQIALDRQSSLGGSLSLAQGRYSAASEGLPDPSNRSAYAYAFYQTRIGDWPRTRLSLTLRRNEQIVLDSAAATGQELQWEQDWLAPGDGVHEPELTSTLGYAWDRSSGQTRRYPTAGLRFRRWFDSRSFINGNLRYTSTQGNLATSRGLSGSVSAERELGQGWRLGLMVSLNEARTTTAALPAFEPTVYRSQERSAYVFLRWEGRAGQPYPVIGQRADGRGTGRIVGQVFLDANGDGRRQADEPGAGRVEVVLGGRYRTLTDAQGRFEFPVVATGAQHLTVTLDTVPLPWGLASEAGTSVLVPLRGDATVELPLVRSGANNPKGTVN